MASHTAGADNGTAGSGEDGGILQQATHDVWAALLDWAQDATVRIAITALAIAIVVILGRLTRRSLEGSARRTALRHNLDDWKTRSLISRTRPLIILVKLVLWTSALVGLLGVWGLRTGFVSVLTAAGFAGIIVGMAAANTLSNLIAGFIIFYNHPFDIGDWVEIEGVEGIIVDVKAGATKLETWDGEKVTFPNRLVEGTKVRNMSHQRKLRRRFRVGVDYSTDVHTIRLKLIDLLASHPDILKEPAPQVIGVGFGDSSIDLELRYWVLPLRTHTMLIQTWLIEEVQRLFAREGVVIPFPQRTMVHRYPGADPPPGDTLSTLTYDKDKDDRPFPAPPIPRPADTTSPSARQSHPAFRWFRGHGETKTADDRRQT